MLKIIDVQKMHKALEIVCDNCVHNGYLFILFLKVNCNIIVSRRYIQLCNM